MTNRLINGIDDLVAGIRQHRVWVALASEDITDQHRRTPLGPFWLLVNYLAFVATFILFFNLGDGSPYYAVYAATGLLVWLYIAEVVTVSVTLFEREQSFITGTTLPISVYVFRAALQSAIRAGYALGGWVLVMLFCGVYPEPGWLLALVGIAIVLLVTPPTIIVCAFCGLVFPDSQHIINNLMRIGMFVTPVFWVDPGIGGVRGLFYHYNPFTYFLDVVRVPVLEGRFSLRALVACSVVALVMWLIALLLLGTYRRRVSLLL